MDDLLEIVRKERVRRQEVIEKACEEMLTDPRGWGIIVIDDPIIYIDRPFDSSLYNARLDPGVPYGHIYSFPSEEAVDTWRSKNDTD